MRYGLISNLFVPHYSSVIEIENFLKRISCAENFKLLDIGARDHTSRGVTKPHTPHVFYGK